MELLTTLVVVSVLAALLLASVAKARSASRGAVCRGNLRQLALALILYADDHGTFPPAVHISGLPREVEGGASLWNAHLLRYVGGNRETFYCPAYPAWFRWDQSPSRAGFQFPTNIQGGREFSYAINSSGTTTTGALGLHRENLITPRRPSEIVAPSDMIGIGDGKELRFAGKAGRLATGNGYFSIGFFIGRGTNSPTAVGEKHSNGANMVFLDGHVEWAPKTKWLEASPGATRRWNYDNESHPETWMLWGQN